jgi:hypothetical protein
LTWKVRIIGDKNDLAELQKSFANGPINIDSSKNDEYYLISDAFQECTNDHQVSELASKQIALLSGASRLALGGNTPIRPAGVVKENENGTKIVFMHIEETLNVRDSLNLSVTDTDGNVIREIKPADEIPRWIALGMSCDAVAKVFRLYTQPLDWVGLYRIYEVIEHDMKGVGDAIVLKGWAKKTEINRFKHTSNSPGAVGDNARHGKEDSQPPKKPMPLHEARNLVERLTGLWLKSKAQRMSKPLPNRGAEGI